MSNMSNKKIYIPFVRCIQSIKFHLFKLYYKHIDLITINHYRLILHIEEYAKILKKCMSAENDSQDNQQSQLCSKIYNRLNYESKPVFKEEFSIHTNICMKIREDIENTYNIISIQSPNFLICSEYFRDFYIEKFYHLEQRPDYAIKEIRRDISKHNI